MKAHLRSVVLAAVVLSAAAAHAGAQPKPAPPRLVAHTGQGALNSVAFSPDGKRVLTAGTDTMARLWDAESGQELRQFKGHGWEVTSVAISPDGKQVLTASADHSARLWDAESGKSVRTFKGPSASVMAVAFSPDGKRVLTGSKDNSARLWDADTGKEIRKFEGHTGPVDSVAFSPDAKRVLTASDDKTARYWDADTGKELCAFVGHNAVVRAAAFAPDGKRVLTGSADKTARLWDADTGQVVRTFKGHGGAVLAVAFSPDGKRILTGSDDKTARLWDADTGKEVRALKGHWSSVTAVAFSPDGKGVLTGGRDATAHLWDAETGEELRRFAGEANIVRAVAISPDGARLLTWSGTIHVWDGKTGKEVRRFGPHKPITAAAFSPDRKRAVLGVDTLAVLWDAETGEELRTFKGHTNTVTAAAFSADGKWVLTGSIDHSARLWDAETGKELRRFTGHAWEVTSVAISPDGKQVLTGSKDNSARLWDAESGRELRRFEGHTTSQGKLCHVTWVAFSPKGDQVLTAGEDASAFLWDAATGEKKRGFIGHVLPLTSAVFSPDGDRVLTCSWDSTARVWDARNSKGLRRLTGHSYWVLAGTFTPDGKRILTGGGDQTARLWDAATGQELCRLITFRDGSWAVVDAAGRYDASNAGEIDGLHWVIGNEIVALKQLKERYYDPGLLAKHLGLSDEKLRNVAAFEDVKLFPAVAVARKDPKKPVLEVSLTNRGGGIGRVIVLVNGKEKTDDARPRGATDEKADKLRITVNLANDPRVVPGGRNTVEVLAYNADGSLCSRGMVREFDDPNPPSKDPPHLYAVVAGVSKYRGDKLNLRYAAKDADDFAAALQLAAGRLFGADKVHVTRLTGATEETRPTRAALDKALAALKQTKAGDVIVVYLAGHGVTTGGQDGEWYYLSADAQPADVSDSAVLKRVGVSSAELTDLVKTSPAQKQVLILDTCHSGRVAEKLTDHRDVPGSQVRALERVKDRTGMFVLAGCAADSVSYEASRYGQGLLTYSLLLAMRGAKLRDGEFVDVAELFGYAADKVPELARDVGGVQRPLIASPKGQPFDIGRLTPEDRKKVPLQSVKPVIVRSSFQLEKPARDSLALSRRIDGRLREASAAARGGKLVYVEADEFPGGVQASGRYTVEGDKVTVSVSLYQGDKQLATFKVGGAASKPDELAEKIAAEVEKRLPAGGGQ